jgi:hypothetical protein
MKAAIRFVAAATLAAGASPCVAHAQTQWCSAPYYVEQAFPIAGPEQTRWKLCWQVLNGPNLVITSAWFRPAPTAQWIKLIYDARVSQLFVPYHPGWPRYYDIGYGFGAVPLVTKDCPSPGVILGTGKETCKQVRDRGLAWKHDWLMRRGEELTLWSVMAAANYNYIVEWSFRDDGVVVARVGATGQIAGTKAHMHGPIWRLDLDLDGAWGDVASRFTHAESGTIGTDTHTDVAAEAGIPFDAPSFPMLKIRDQALVTSPGQHQAWHLMPLVFGTPKHSEAFTQNAFWVTRYKWSEMLGDNLPAYVTTAEPALNQDIVLWYYAGLHHLIRSEDTNMTHVMWVGFMLMPSNVWTKTPLYP